MRRIRAGWVAVAIAPLCVWNAQAMTIVESSFDGSAEGWEVTWDANASLSGWMPAGGNPGGCLHGVDSRHNVAWYYDASDDFLGDMSASYMGWLSFDLVVNTLDTPIAEDISDIVLFGNGISLHYGLEANPGLEWTPYSIALQAAAGWRAVTDPVALDMLRTMELGSMASATEEQMMAVLGDLQRIVIRGEYSHGPDAGCIDNVAIYSLVDPASTVALLGLAIIPIEWVRRRSRRSRPASP